jgi:hypothetical protein
MLINYMLKCRVPRSSRQNARLMATAGFLWMLTAFAVSIYPADGAMPTAELEESEARMLSPGGPGAARNLLADARCDPVKLTAIAQLSWKSASPPAGQQRVDLTMFRDGFDKGKFTTLGPLPPDQSQVQITSGEPGINYYWRVLTLTESGWVPSKTERLPWPSCPTNTRSPLVK